MKKFLSLTLAILLCAGVFISCGKSESNEIDAEYLKYEYDLSEYIKLPEIHNREVESYVFKVTENDVETSIQQSLIKNATEVTDRAVIKGDVANIDYAGKYADTGVAFSGGSAKATDLIIGSNTFIPGFEEGIIGMTKGQTKSINLTFPENYHNSELAGKAVIFDVTLNKISLLPELTDKLVASLKIDKVKTVDEYYKYMKERLEESAKTQTEQYKKEAFLELIFSEAEVKKYPEKEIKYYTDIYTKNDELRAQSSNKTIEEYITENYESKEKYDAMIKSEVESLVKTDMVVHQMARTIDVSVSKKDYQEGLEELYNQQGAAVGASSIDMFEDMFSDKVYLIVLSTMVLEELNDEITVKDINS